MTLVDADKFEIIKSDGLNAGFELYEGVVLTVGAAVDDQATMAAFVMNHECRG